MGYQACNGAYFAKTHFDLQQKRCSKTYSDTQGLQKSGQIGSTVIFDSVPKGIQLRFNLH